MSKYAQIYRSFLDENNYGYETPDDHVICITYKGKNMQRIPVFIFFQQDDAALVQVMCGNIINLKGKEAQAHEICNSINRHNRWAKFSCHEDSSDIFCTMDALISEETVCNIVSRLLQSTVNLVDGSYPQFAKAKWA